MSIRAALNNKNLRSILAESWAVSWPMTVIMFCTFLIGLADVYVAGKFGKEIQAAYGFGFQLFFILSIIGTALTIGAVSLVARLFTSDQKEELRATIDTSLIVVGTAGIILSLVGFVISPYLIRYSGLPEALKEPAQVLLRIYALGLIANYILVNTNGLLRACKMIQQSLWTMTVVCILNVILNFVLSFQCGFGFKGIAIATIISTAIGCGMNVFFIRRILKGPLRFSKAALRSIISIGWPAGVLQIVWQAGSIILFLIIGALPRYPIEIMAAFTNGLRIESVIFLPAFAFNMANAVVVGNLIGKKEYEDAFHSGIITGLLGVGVVTVMTVLVMLNARSVAALLSDNEVVIAESVRYIFISLISEPFMAWGVILGGALNGVGDTKSVMWGVAISVWLVKIPLSYLFAIHFGFGAIAIWWVMNAAMLAQALFIGKRYFAKRWLHTD